MSKGWKHFKTENKNKTDAEGNQSTIDLAFRWLDCWLILSPRAGLNGEMFSDLVTQQKVVAETGSAVQTAVSMLQPVKAVHAES